MGDWGARIHDREGQGQGQGQGPGRGSFSSARVLFWGLASPLLLVLAANCGTTSTASNDPPAGSDAGGALEQGSTDSAAATTTATGSGGSSTTSATSASTVGGEPDSSAAGARNMEPDASVEPVDASDAGLDADEEADADPPVETEPAVPSAGCDAPSTAQYISVSTGAVRIAVPLYSQADAPAPLILGFHATNGGAVPYLIDADGPFIREYMIAMPSAVDLASGTWEYEGSDVLEEIYDALEATYCFDTRRVYAVGHASGGRYLQSALCDIESSFKPSELFRAVALQGAMNDRACESSRVFPTLFVHSVFDSVATQYDEADNSGAVQMMFDANECEAPGMTRTGECSSTNFECVDNDGCSAPFRDCIHDLEIHGRDDWPCFATDEIHRFFEELR